MANIEIPVFGTGFLVSGVVIIIVSVASMLATAPFPVFREGARRSIRNVDVHRKFQKDSRLRSPPPGISFVESRPETLCGGGHSLFL